MYDSYSNEYCYPLAPSILKKLENQNIKIILKVKNFFFIF